MISVADNITKNAKSFFDSLLVAKQGFYLIEADEDIGLKYLRAYDYRNRTEKGLVIFLTEPFANKSLYD